MQVRGFDILRYTTDNFVQKKIQLIIKINKKLKPVLEHCDRVEKGMFRETSRLLVGLVARICLLFHH